MGIPNGRPGDPEAARAAFLKQVSDLRMRMQRMKLLAPEFRADPAVNQLLDYRAALGRFMGELAGDGYPSPLMLSDEAFFGPIGMSPFLPPMYREPQRQGYAFEFSGECGVPSKIYATLQDLCRSFAYVARPVDSSVGNGNVYALLSGDMRVHYRADGAVPGDTDPIVDNTSPSSAADLPGGAPDPPAKEPESGVLRALLRSVQALIDGALGGTAKATASLHEANAIQDLRTLAAAEVAFANTAGLGSGYLAPAQLADADLSKAIGMQPLLPGYFVQPLRQGYQFEFIGELLTSPPPSLARFGTIYRSFIYAARPVDPGPAGRRSVAVYEDGLIFATTANRVPTRKDTRVDGR